MENPIFMSHHLVPTLNSLDGKLFRVYIQCSKNISKGTQEMPIIQKDKRNSTNISETDEIYQAREYLYADKSFKIIKVTSIS